ncbi:MAG TPA: RES family NAD+ phosphorylase [Rhodopila sp.]|nr:RES family NAD+ phosphorylase [Rhodopila sp.]
MLAWRLCRRPHADLSGEGARRLGGRWNSPGRPLIYLAEHPALAALEVRVHLDLPFDLLPADYVLLSISVPDGSIRDTASAADTVATGNAWLAARDTAALRVPSVLVSYAFNVLLNPLHPAAADAAIASIEPFCFDPRLWQPLGHE